MGVTIDYRQVTAKLLQMKQRFPVACSRALNRAATSSRAAMVTVVAADIGVAASVARNAMAIRQSTPSRLVAQVVATGKPIPLIDLNAKGPEPSRGKGRGVTYRLKGGKGRIENAFIATMRSGHRGVFKRRGLRRLPINELHGPSIAHVFSKHHQVGLTRGMESLNTNLSQQMRYVMGL